MNDLPARLSIASSRRGLRSAAFLAVLLAAPAALAAETFDAIRFDAPPGFTAEKSGDHLGYTRIDGAAKTFCQIGLYASRPAANPVEQEFSVEWQQLALGAASKDIPPLTSGKTRAGIPFAQGEQTVTKAGQTYRTRLYALQADRAVLSILVNASNPAALKSCEPALEGMLASMTLLHPPAAASASPAPSATRAGVETADVPRGKGLMPGLWMGVEWSSLGHSQGTGGLNERYAAFYDDGTWFFDVPPSGYTGFSRAASKADPHRASYWGTWKFSGSEGEVVRSGVTRRMPIKAVPGKDDEIELDGTHYYKLRSVDGLKLDGAWTSYADPTDPGLRKGGVQPVLHFTPDGKFRDEGLFQLYLGITDDPASKMPGSGTYTIKDWTLILQYDDGHVRTASFSMFTREKPDPKAKSLYIQHARLSRLP